MSERQDEGGKPPDYETQRGTVAPDAMRLRALTFAGLLVTVIGGMTAGILFSSRPLTALTKIAAFLLIASLTVSVGFFSASGLYARGKREGWVVQAWRKIKTRQPPTSTKGMIGQVVESIFHRTRWGVRFAGLSAVFAVVISGALLWPLTDKAGVEVVLTDEGYKRATQICPGLPNRFRAEVDATTLGADTPLVTFDSGKI